MLKETAKNCISKPEKQEFLDLFQNKAHMHVSGFLPPWPGSSCSTSVFFLLRLFLSSCFCVWLSQRLHPYKMHACISMYTRICISVTLTASEYMYICLSLARCMLAGSPADAKLFSLHAPRARGPNPLPKKNLAPARPPRKGVFSWRPRPGSQN